MLYAGREIIIGWGVGNGTGWLRNAEIDSGK